MGIGEDIPILCVTGDRWLFSSGHMSIGYIVVVSDCLMVL